MIPKFIGGFGQFVRRKFGNRTDYVPTVGSGSGTLAVTHPSMLATVGVFLSIVFMPMLILGALVAALTFGVDHTSVLALAGSKLLLANGPIVTVNVQETIDKLHKAFDAFREANDERLKALETKGAVDPLLTAKVDKANGDITNITAELKTQRDAIRDAQIQAARFAPMTASDKRDKEMAYARQFFSLSRGQRVTNVSDDEMQAYRAYVEAQAQYFRRGDKALADDNIRAALNTGVSTEGGYWLAPETTGRVIEWIEDISTLRSLAAVSPIGTDTYEGFYDLDEADSGWVGEETARPETDAPRIDGKFSFPIHEQYANPKTSQKMLDDSLNDVEGWLAKKVGTKLGKRENNAFVLGDGVLKPKGFLTYASGTPARTSVALYRKIRQINTGKSADFADVDPADKFIDLVTSLPSELRKGAVFAMNQLTLAETRKIKDGEGRYVFIPDFSANPNGSILGHGIAELNDMPDIAASSLSIAFANFKEGYEIKDHRVGIRVLRDPYTAKPYVQFYTTKRVGGDVTNFQAITLLKFAA
jgi:HK97 family phage major capsid protein